MDTLERSGRAARLLAALALFAVIVPSAALAQQAAVAQQQAQAAGSPAIGTVVPALPAGCAAAPKGGVEYFRCGNVYYRSAFQGNNLVYAVVPQP
jgi:hypothetical protein